MPVIDMPTHRTDSLSEKSERMRAILRELDSVAVAFSAGVDSTLVLKVALDTLGSERVVAVTGRSESLARAEFDAAVRLASSVGAEHVVLDTDEFDNPNYTNNPANRCYFCKTTLYEHLTHFIRQRRLNAMVNGINADDLGDYRPGIQAAREFGVRCPAAEAGLTKADVREWSRRLGLPTFDKPASPCLSSRIPYGQAVTPEKLRMIEAAEAFLHELGFSECRVRHHETHASIEVPTAHVSRLEEPQLLRRVKSQLQSIGYERVEIDRRGFRSGSLNEAILVQVRSAIP